MMDLDRSGRAGLVLGVTARLRGPLSEHWDAVLAIHDRVMARPWASAFKVQRDSSTTQVIRLEAKSLPRARAILLGGRGRGPCWTLDLADGLPLPKTIFRILSVSALKGTERTSLIELKLPPGSDPQILREEAQAWADQLPIWCGSAGWFTVHSEADRGASWDELWALARRYWGADVEPSETTTWDAVGGLIAANWLTLVGQPLAEERGMSDAIAKPAPPLTCLKKRHAWIVQAGTEPELGDINAGRFPEAYAAAYKLLEPAMTTDRTDLPGRFTDQKCTDKWRRRFVDPAAWLAVDPE